MLIGADDLEDHDRLAALIRVTAAALPATKPKKAKPSKAGEKAKKPGKRATTARKS